MDGGLRNNMPRCLSHALYTTLRHKIVPFVSLHHFVHPIWFEHLGGFQKEENIAFFVDYAKLTFR